MHLPFLKCCLVSQTHRDGTWQMPVYVHDFDYLYCVARSASERVRARRKTTQIIHVTTQATLHDTTQRPNVQPTSLTHTDTVHVILLQSLYHTRTVKVWCLPSTAHAHLPYARSSMADRCQDRRPTHPWSLTSYYLTVP